MKKTASSPRTLSVGGAAYDLFIGVDPAVQKHDGTEMLMLPIGGKVRIGDVHETCGGGAANSATGLARLGCDACFCGIVGNDKWGERMLESLRKEGVDTRCATVVEHEMTGFSVILLLPNGERTILHHAGTNAHLHDVTFDRNALNDVDAVYVNRLSDSAHVIQDDIVSALTAHPDIHLTWNPGGAQLTGGIHQKDTLALLQVTDLLLLNKEEAALFTETKDITDALKILRAAGVHTVCITDGKAGAWAMNGDATYHVASITDVNAVDTTGAGDAFGSALTWALLSGHPLPFALQAGTLNAASVVSAIGAQAGLLTDTDITLAIRDHPPSVTNAAR